MIAIAQSSNGGYSIGVYVFIVLAYLFLLTLFVVSVGLGVGMPIAVIREWINPDSVKLNQHDKTGPNEKKRAPTSSSQQASSPEQKQNEVDKVVLAELTSALVNLGFKKSEAKARALQVIKAHEGIAIENAIPLALHAELTIIK
jgi:hypothetical protein